MVEDLRSPVIDRLVLYVINKGALKPTQFTEVEGKKAVRMNDIARKVFLSSYEKFMTAHFQDPSTGKRRNYREVLKEKVMKLERAVLRAEYNPYVYSP